MSTHNVIILEKKAERLVIEVMTFKPKEAPTRRFDTRLRQHTFPQLTQLWNGYLISLGRVGSDEEDEGPRPHNMSPRNKRSQSQGLLFNLRCLFLQASTVIYLLLPLYFYRLLLL